jgi:hypothetical protein
MLVGERASVQMEEYRASQYAAFDVPALANQVFRTVLVADAFDVLLDPRSHSHVM